MRRWMRLGAAVVSVVLIAAACGGGAGEEGEETGAPKIVEGGILRLGSSSTIDSLNPFKAFQQDAYNTFMYIYPFLVQYDENLDIVGDFAEDWEWSDDRRSVTFHTIEGGKWSDGQPVTAEDAAYTLNLMLKYPGPTGLMAGYAKHIVSAETPDPNTLVVGYEAPVNEAWALSQLELIPILPEQVWSQQEGDNGKGLRTFTNDAPIVSGGPFVLTEYEKRDIAQFAKNPDFYGPAPHIDGFGLKFYTNEDAMISALLNDELDAVETFLPTALEKVQADPDMVVVETEGVYFDDFIFNSNKPIHEELLDPKLREAFAHAIDLQELVDVVTLGHGQIGTTIVPPVTGEWYNPNVQAATYDIDLANQMLDDLGFEMGPDGVRIANGRPMEYEVLTPDSVSGIDREFQIIQAGLEQIGVKVTQKKLDPSAVFDVMAGPEYVYPESYDKFDLAIWDWYPLIDPDFILSVLICEQWGFWSDTGYCNKEYDQLYEDQGLAVDPEARKEIVWQMQEMIANDRPYLVLMHRNVIEAHNKQWDGFVISPQGSFNNLWKATLINVHQVG